MIELREWIALYALRREAVAAAGQGPHVLAPRRVPARRLQPDRAEQRRRRAEGRRRPHHRHRRRREVRGGAARQLPLPADRRADRTWTSSRRRSASRTTSTRSPCCASSTSRGGWSGTTPRTLGRRSATRREIGVRFFSSEAAMNILGEMGVKKVRTLGIDGGTRLRHRVLGPDGAREQPAELRRAVPRARGHRRQVRHRLRPADRADAGLLRPATSRRSSPRGCSSTRSASTRAGRSASTRCSNLPTPVPKDPKNRGRTGFSFSRFHIPKLAGYKGRGALRRRRHAGVRRHRRALGHPVRRRQGHVHAPGRAAGAVEGLELVPSGPPAERDDARLRAARLGHRRDRRRPRRGALRLPAADVRALHRRRRTRSTTTSRRSGTTSSTTCPARPSSFTTPSCRRSRGRTTRAR